MADETSSAAERVFGVAELAEHILLYLAQAGIEADGGSPNHGALQPLACLSAVQRVSCAFRDTTTTSKKIQRLMQTTTKNDTDAHIRWLLKDNLGLSFASGIVRWFPLQYSPIADKGIEEINTQKGSLRTKFEHFSSGYKSASEAGWRNIKITDSAHDSRSIKIMAVRFDSGKWCGGYGVDWDFGSGATLGMLFDRYHEIMGRTRKQHRQSWRDYRDAIRKLSRGPGRGWRSKSMR